MNEIEQRPERSGEEDEDDVQREHGVELAVSKTPEPAKEHGVETSRKNWREVAAFFISFGYVRDKGGEERLHTKVQLRGGKAEQWEGVAPDQLIRWMASQAGLPLPPEPESPVETASLAEATLPLLPAEATLELAGLWVSEVTTPALAGKPQGIGLLRAEGRLNLSGATAHDLTTDRLPFNIELYLVNTQTHQSRLVATQSGQLGIGELSYEFRQDFPIPAAGRYQLYAVARLLTPDDAIVHLQGPIIKVEN